VINEVFSEASTFDFDLISSSSSEEEEDESLIALLLK
jgi:hypothetical protein